MVLYLAGAGSLQKQPCWEIGHMEELQMLAPFFPVAHARQSLAISSPLSC